MTQVAGRVSENSVCGFLWWGWGRTQKGRKEMGLFSLWSRNANPLKGYADLFKKHLALPAELSQMLWLVPRLGQKTVLCTFFFLCTDNLHKISSYLLLNYFTPVSITPGWKWPKSYTGFVKLVIIFGIILPDLAWKTFYCYWFCCLMVYNSVSMNVYDLIMLLRSSA